MNLANVIFMLEHSVKLRRYFGSTCCMLCMLHSMQNTHTSFHDMLPHNRIINNDVIPPIVLT